MVILLGSVPLAMFGAMIFTVLKVPDPNTPYWTNGWTSTMNIYAQVGLVTLVGLIAKNGILIVEFANKLQEEGYGKLQAVLRPPKPVQADIDDINCNHRRPLPLTLVEGPEPPHETPSVWFWWEAWLLAHIVHSVCGACTYMLIARTHQSEDAIRGNPRCRER